MEDRAPDCATPRAARVAGIIANAVMAHEMDFGQDRLPGTVLTRISKVTAGEAGGDDLTEGFRVAGLMISARARASVRTPSQAALSGAEAALALAEDWLSDRAGEDLDLTEAHAVLTSIRDALRAGLAPLHAADGPPAA